MSFQDGWSAINLQMPKRVPRTEYSVDGHWELVTKVTGIPVTVESPDAIKKQAQSAFVGPAHWNFDFFWSTLISSGDLGKWRTNMGHAVYAAGGVDYNNRIASPFKEVEDVLAFDPLESLPHIDIKQATKRFEEHFRRNAEARPDGVTMTGTYITCVSGLIDMFGWEHLLTAMGLDPVQLGKIADRYAGWMDSYFSALAAANVPVVMVHDDIVWTEGAIFPPAWYRQHVFPHYRRWFGLLRDSGKKIMFTSDGNYTEFVDDIAAAGNHGFVMEPTTDMAMVAEKYGSTHCFIGNADTRILLSGTREAIRAEVERCMSIGKKHPGFFMAVGNHIPSNTPVENCIYYNEMYEELSRR